MQKEAIKRLKEDSSKVGSPSRVFHWFRSKENQIALIKNLRTLMELDYETTPEKAGQERREIAENRTFTLFLFCGDSFSLDHLQSQIQLREHDIIERYGPEEIRGVLTHLKEVDPLEMEKKFQQFMESKGLTKLKCLLLPIHSPKDLEGNRSDLIRTTLQEVTEGKPKILSI
jgi:hypothetical protein